MISLDYYDYKSLKIMINADMINYAELTLGTVTKCLKKLNY